MNILKWMWKILPIMLLAVNATACNDDDDPVYPVDEELAERKATYC